MLAFGAATRAGVVGQSGTGKSTHAKRVIAAQTTRPRVVAWDPDDEWSQEGDGSQQVDLGPLLKRVSWSDLNRDPARHLDFEELSFAVVPDESDDPDAAAEDFADFVRLCRAEGDLLVVVEEMGDVAGPDVTSREGKNAASLLARKGRHWGPTGCPSLYVGQRLVQIPPTARAQLGALVTFRQTHPADLSALVELTGDSNLADRVQSLPDFECIEWLAGARAPTKEKHT